MFKLNDESESNQDSLPIVRPIIADYGSRPNI